jgi:hypothetical protein
LKKSFLGSRKNAQQRKDSPENNNGKGWRFQFMDEILLIQPPEENRLRPFFAPRFHAQSINERNSLTPIDFPAKLKWEDD